MYVLCTFHCILPIWLFAPEGSFWRASRRFTPWNAITAILSRQNNPTKNNREKNDSDSNDPSIIVVGVVDQLQSSVDSNDLLVCGKYPVVSYLCQVSPSRKEKRKIRQWPQKKKKSNHATERLSPRLCSQIVVVSRRRPTNLSRYRFISLFLYI